MTGHLPEMGGHAGLKYADDQANPRKLVNHGKHADLSAIGISDKDKMTEGNPYGA
jgi:hypothetical protein